MGLLGLLEHSTLKPHNSTATVLFFHSEIFSPMLFQKLSLKTSAYLSDILSSIY